MTHLGTLSKQMNLKAVHFLPSVPLGSTYLLLVPLLLPIYRPYLPGNTTLLDWVNVVFLPVLWLRIAWRRTCDQVHLGQRAMDRGRFQGEL